MKDERLQKLASLLLNYSLGLQKGELFEINSGILAKPLIKALICESHRIGAIPFLKLSDDELSRLAFGYIHPDEQEEARVVIEKQMEWETVYWDHLAAHVDIGVDENDAELSAVNEQSMCFYREVHRPIRDRMIDERRWVYLHWPTMADAQKAGMCYDDFFEFFINAALVDYAKMKRDLEPLVDLLEKTDTVRILGPGTDISFSIKGIPVVSCHGNMNVPDGEVFTAPVKDSVVGHIQFNTVAMRYGRKFANPRLVFQNGLIVEADCDGNRSGFNEMLDADEGARYVGEFALGVNNAITKAIGNTLYDEKIGGSFHLTPGCAYADADNGNKSQLHLDIVCLQSSAMGGGEIWLDGCLVRKDGIFTLDSLKELNP